MEAFVELLCPNCEKHWEETPTDLPGPGRAFTCPDCGEERALSEFARTSRDLDVMRETE